MTTLQPKDKADPRTMSRLGAVQALFQMEQSGAALADVVKEFQEHRLGGEIENIAILDADDSLFEDIMYGVIRTQDKIDPYIEGNLKKGWTLKRIDSTARAIMRASIYEMISRPDIPFRVVINEYMEIANSFFEKGAQESSFINAILDKAAQEIR